MRGFVFEDDEIFPFSRGLTIAVVGYVMFMSGMIIVTGKINFSNITENVLLND